MEVAVGPLIATLRQALPLLEVRTAPASGEYLEGVLSRPHLQQCCDLLAAAFGPAAKDFGAAAELEPSIQKAIDAIGGIRVDQCLFLGQGPGRQTTYAALWPWASDPARVTLKVGVVKVG